jgi:hypothetical protein
VGVAALRALYFLAVMEVPVVVAVLVGNQAPQATLVAMVVMVE